jgi:hypothetical protein
VGAGWGAPELILLLTLALVAAGVVVQAVALRAQAVSSQFEGYLRVAYAPVSKEQIEELKLYPEDYMDRQLYESEYKDREDSLRRYIYFYVVYEYLGISWPSRHLRHASVGAQWTEMWTRDLVKEKEFKDAHKALRGFYTDYSSIVEKCLNLKPA